MCCLKTVNKKVASDQTCCCLVHYLTLDFNNFKACVSIKITIFSYLSEAVV